MLSYVLHTVNASIGVIWTGSYQDFPFVQIYVFVNVSIQVLFIYMLAQIHNLPPRNTNMVAGKKH